MQLRRFGEIACTLAFLISGVSYGAEWYVDAVGGDDANSGTSALDAWKTITYAISAVPGGGDVIHVAPGVYDEALGETFEWSPPSGTTIEGAGPDSVLLSVASGVGRGFFRVDSSMNGGPVDLHIRGLEVQCSSFGSLVEAFVNDSNPGNSIIVEDVKVACSGLADIILGGAFVEGSLRLDVRRAEYLGPLGGIGIRVVHVVYEPPGGTRFVGLLENTLFTSGSTGVLVRFEPLALSGLTAETLLTVVNSTFYDEDRALELQATGLHPFEYTVTLVNNAFMMNGTVAIDDPASGVVAMRNNAFFGSGETHYRSFAGDATTEDELNALAGASSNLVAEPGFLDEVGGDYHLATGSRLIDAGSDEPLIPVVDFDGDMRPLDGDGDFVALPDIGYDEVVAPPGEAALLRNDEVRSTTPVTPPLSTILPLDSVADVYVDPFTSGSMDPESGILTSRDRPLVFYATEPPRVLRMTKTVAGEIQLFF